MMGFLYLQNLLSPIIHAFSTLNGSPFKNQKPNKFNANSSFFVFVSFLFLADVMKYKYILCKLAVFLLLIKTDRKSMLGLHVLHHNLSKPIYFDVIGTDVRVLTQTIINLLCRVVVPCMPSWHFYNAEKDRSMVSSYPELFAKYEKEFLFFIVHSANTVKLNDTRRSNVHLKSTNFTIFIKFYKTIYLDLIFKTVPMNLAEIYSRNSCLVSFDTSCHNTLSNLQSSSSKIYKVLEKMHAKHTRVQFSF